MLLMLPLICFRVVHDSFEYRLQFPLVFFLLLFLFIFYFFIIIIIFYVYTNNETNQILLS